MLGRGGGGIDYYDRGKENIFGVIIKTKLVKE